MVPGSRQPAVPGRSTGASQSSTQGLANGLGRVRMVEVVIPSSQQGNLPQGDIRELSVRDAWSDTGGTPSRTVTARIHTPRTGPRAQGSPNRWGISR